MSTKDAAIRYAKKGWPVVPLRENDKKPLIPNWTKNGTDNLHVVESWWARWPKANVGILTGERLGAFVLDIDGAHGSQSLTDLENELGALPETLECHTGSSGRHLYFKWNPARPIGNRVNVRPGVDVRGNGGCVVVPPSIHPNGNTYDWPLGDTGTMAELPPAWLNFLAPIEQKVAPWERVSKPGKPPKLDFSKPITDRAAKYLEECDPAVQGQGGHSALLWAARAMVIGFELDDSTALNLLWSVYNPKCQPPWDVEDQGDKDDFERKVAEARRTPSDKPSGWLLDEYKLRGTAEALAQLAKGRELTEALLANAAGSNPLSPDPDGSSSTPEPAQRLAFPIHCFPPLLARYCYEVAESHAVDLSFAALPALCVAGTAMGNAFKLQLKRTWKVPPILWVGLVARSGTNKSGPMKEVIAPIKKPVPMELLEGDEGLLNPQGQVFISDATNEAVVSVLRGSRRGLICYRDELAAWVLGFNAYKKGGGGDEQAWLEFWGGGAYVVNRKTNDEHTNIHAAAVSLLGGIQPEIMVKCFDPSRFASGLVPRILVACPPERDMYWTEVEVSEETETAWEDAIMWLRSRPFADFDPASGAFSPNMLQLSHEAKVSFVTYYNKLERSKRTEPDSNAKSIIAKSREHCGRITLILHGLRCAIDGVLHPEVDIETVDNAIEINEWCLAEQLRVYGFGGRVFNEEEAEYLVRRIKEKHGHDHEISPREVMKLNQRKWKNSSQARASLDELARQGIGTWVNRKKFKLYNGNGNGDGGE